MDVCDSAASDETLVGGFEDRFTEGGIAYDSEASNDHEGGNSYSFVT